MYVYSTEWLNPVRQLVIFWPGGSIRPSVDVSSGVSDVPRCGPTVHLADESAKAEAGISLDQEGSKIN